MKIEARSKIFLVTPTSSIFLHVLRSRWEEYSHANEEGFLRYRRQAYCRMSISSESLEKSSQHKNRRRVAVL